MKERPSAKSSNATPIKSNISDASSIKQVGASCLQKMGYNNNRPQQRQEHEQELFFCSTCSENHPSSECPTLFPLYRPYGYQGNRPMNGGPMFHS